MSKKYKGKTCVYCGSIGSSETADHVLAREFALKRGDIPKVPACKLCNSAKSRLERYLTTVLPFGAKHADAGENLATMVPKRLAHFPHLQAEIDRAVPRRVPSPANDSLDKLNED